MSCSGPRVTDLWPGQSTHLPLHPNNPNVIPVLGTLSHAFQPSTFHADSLPIFSLPIFLFITYCSYYLVTFLLLHTDHVEAGSVLVFPFKMRHATPVHFHLLPDSKKKILTLVPHL